MKPQTIHHLTIDKFICQPQVRDRLDPAKIEQMAQSFKTVGQLQPILARRDGERFVPTDGHYRLAAARHLGWKAIAAILEENPLSAGDVLTRQLIANCQRDDLTDLEIARGIERLMETTGWTASQVATNLGFSNAKVSGLRKLLTLPVGILTEVETGKISASAAAELARCDDPAEQAELAQRLAEGRLTRDGVAGARKAARRAANGDDARLTRVTAPLGEGRSITIAGAELTLESLIEAVEQLLAKARRVRSQGIALRTFVKMLKDQAEGRPD